MKEFKNIPKFDDHERFLSKIRINKNSECWEWQLRLSDGGYGIFSIKGEDYKAHRVSYAIFNGNISNTMDIDHKCRNRSCVNPEHLRNVPRSINITENSLAPACENNTKKCCKYGHEFTPENIVKVICRSGKEGRKCRQCELIYNEKRRKKQC